MVINNVLRRTRAVAANAVVWGGAWFLGVIGLTAIAGIFSTNGRADWRESFELAAQGAVLFSVAGAVFSTFIIFAFRGRQLSKIRWLRFGIGGGIVSAIFLPTFISVARFMSGDNMLPLTKLLSTGLLGLIFGSIAAAGTLRLAQVADRLLAKKSADEVDRLEGEQKVAVPRQLPADTSPIRRRPR